VLWVQGLPYGIDAGGWCVSAGPDLFDRKIFGTLPFSGPEQLMSILAVA